MAAKRQAPPDFADVYEDLAGNVTAIADHYAPCSRGKVREWRDALGLDAWEVVGASVNANGGISKRLKPVAPPTLLLAARPDGWKAPPLKKRRLGKAPETYAMFSDYQFPFYEKPLHELSLGVLEDTRPNNILYPGDTYDFPDVSKYPDKEEWAASLNVCTTTGYHVIRDHTYVAPQARRRKFKGNHEKRLEDYIKANAPALWGVRPAATEPGNEWHYIKNLCRLDDLGVEVDETRYPEGEIVLSDKLVVVHGQNPRPDSGASVKSAMNRVDYSVVQGDCHRQGMYFETRWDPDGTENTRVGMELGCMCVRPGGLGYAGRRPNWQNGFGFATVWPDGRFHLELATYVRGALYFRGKRY